MSYIWTVEWPHGSFNVHARGGMLGGVILKLADGREVMPFYEAPWLNEGETAEPQILNNLRSEFPCVPFGADYPVESVIDEWKPGLAAEISPSDIDLDTTDLLLHGYCSAADWYLIQQTDRHIEIAIDYPRSSPIRRLVRTISADLNGPCIDFSLKIEMRTAARRPVGLHPNFAVPHFVGALQISPGEFQFGIIHPAGPEKGVSRASPGALFEDLREVPLLAGGTAPFDRLPFSFDTEEVLQLCGVDGTVTVVNAEDSAEYTLSWDEKILPSLLLWISNRGRSYAPWSGRNLCVGIEPMIGTFDLGSRMSLAPNPISRRGIATALTLDPENPTTIQYRFAAKALEGSL